MKSIVTEDSGITRLQYSKQPISTTTTAHATIKELWEAVFSMQSVPIATSCNNRRTVGRGVFCAVSAKDIQRGPTAIRQKRRRLV
jgi:hypothetical protein